MKKTTLILLAFSFVLFAPFAFSQTIAGCEITEEFKVELELTKKSNIWLYELTGNESNMELTQQKIRGFCMQKFSFPDFPTIWYSNKSSAESPMSLYIEVYENGDMLPVLEFGHPERVEEYITTVRNLDNIEEFFNWVDESSIKNEDVVLSHSGNTLRIDVEILEDGTNRYEIDWEKPEWKFLQEMSLTSEPTVLINGISYEMNSKAKNALGEMIFLWDNHWKAFQY